jgi:hypothetical protein
MPKRNPEIDADIERKAIESAAWLGGYFEAGGTLSFTVVSRKTRHGRSNDGYPFLTVSENDESIIKWFKERFGGKTHQAGQSAAWEVTKTKAYIIASSFADFAPSRKEAMAALSNWINSEGEERVQIARAMKGYDRLADAKKQEYLPLVRKSDFLAGVIDSRGTLLPIRSNEGAGKASYDYLRVNTVNRPLLDALKEEYGGHIVTALHAGSNWVNPKGLTGISHRDTYYWGLPYSKTGELIDFMKPHLKFNIGINSIILGSQV